MHPPALVRVMRIHPTSLGCSPGELVAGEDLVLRLAERDALSTPVGVAADDHLDAAGREMIDETALLAVVRWRADVEPVLTVAGTSLPFLDELSLVEIAVQTLREGTGLWHAVHRHRPHRLVLHGGDERVRALVRTIATSAGLEFEEVPGDALREEGIEPVPKPLVQRVRQHAVRRMLERGAPTRLRPGCVLAVSYWPLMPVLDALLDDHRVAVAVPLQKLPTRPQRSLRAMADGGWLGRPGPTRIRQEEGAVEAALQAARRRTPPRLEIGPWPLEDAVHGVFLDRLSVDAAQNVATAKLIRGAFARSRPRLVLTTLDSVPFPRTVVSEANAAGIPTFILAHGAYLMPQTIKDMELADEAAIYSDAVGIPGMRRDRPVHVIGYPGARHTSTPPREARRVVVLGANGHPTTSMFDERVGPRHYEAALGALADAAPDADVVLRPHPSQDLTPVRQLAAAFPTLRVRIDAVTPILELLGSAGLCIASLTTAALQSVLVETPTVVLNVSGFDWAWPLGGDTSVPVATDAAALADWLRRWSSGETLPGQADLTAALGADRTGVIERLSELVVSATRSDPSSRS